MEHSYQPRWCAGYPKIEHSKRIQRQMVIQTLNEGVCQKLMRNKYLKKHKSSTKETNRVALFLTGLIVVKEPFLSLRNHQ